MIEMNPNYHIKIKVIERRSWGPEAVLITCDNFKQLKKQTSTWEKKLVDMIWNDSSLILDPPHLYYEVEFKAGEHFANVSFDDLKVLKKWLRNKELE
jgi:hypothetical protein